MNQVFTREELEAKGFAKKDVVRMMKKCETRVNAYIKQYMANGNKCSQAFQAAWDAECARWDHLKATAAQWD